MMLESSLARLLTNNLQTRNKSVGKVQGLITNSGHRRAHYSKHFYKGNLMHHHIVHHPVIQRAVQSEAEIGSMSNFLDSIKWDSNGLAVAIAQDIDTGEVLMQAFVDRNAVNETLQTGYVAMTAGECEHQHL
jgi:hypothetical protein